MVRWEGGVSLLKSRIWPMEELCPTFYSGVGVKTAPGRFYLCIFVRCVSVWGMPGMQGREWTCDKEYVVDTDPLTIGGYAG